MDPNSQMKDEGGPGISIFRGRVRRREIGADVAPEMVAPVPWPWLQFCTPEDTTYYYNPDNNNPETPGGSTWTLPSTLRFARDARGKIRRKHAPPLSDGWEQFTTDDTNPLIPRNQYYYYNVRTGVRTWEDPRGYGSETGGGSKNIDKNKLNNKKTKKNKLIKKNTKRNKKNKRNKSKKNKTRRKKVKGKKKTIKRV